MFHLKFGSRTFSLLLIFRRCSCIFKRILIKVNLLIFVSQHANGTTRSESHADGYSFPLCAKIIETLGERRERFHIRTLLILGHNTKGDSEGNACPIFNGFMVSFKYSFLCP